MLDHIERKHDIEIIHAVECGSREWSLSAEDPKTEICLIYIRNNKTNYVTSPNNTSATHPKCGLFFDSDDSFKWTAYDITDMAHACVYPHLLTYASAVDVLFASNVFKTSAHKYPFVEQMRNELVANPRVADLLERHSTVARSILWVLGRTPRYKRVSFFVYMAVIREVATLEWLKVKFVRNPKDTGAEKLVETNLTRMIDDLRPHLDAGLYNQLKSLDAKSTQSHDATRQTRLPKVDEWITRTCKESYDLFIQARAKEAYLADNLAAVFRITKANLNIKFNTLSAAI